CLTPEWLPVSRDGQLVCLDTICPISRTLDIIVQPPVPRCSEKSLAIIYAEDPELRFDLVADRLKEDLDGLLTVDTFAGQEFDSGERRSKPLKVLREVFLRHRAVLFIGHLFPAG